MKIFKHQHWHILILIGLLYTLNYYTSQDSNVFTGSLWNISTENWFILAILSPIIHQIYVLLCWRYELFYKGLTNIFKENAFKIYKKYVERGRKIGNLRYVGRHAEFKYWGMPETVNSAYQKSKEW